MNDVRVLAFRVNCPETDERMATSLKAQQRFVGGSIEVIKLGFDDVTGDALVVVCNEEGKCAALPPNRPLRLPDGRIMDIIVGDFFVSRVTPDGEHADLTDADVAHYKKIFARAS